MLYPILDQMNNYVKKNRDLTLKPMDFFIFIESSFRKKQSIFQCKIKKVKKIYDRV